MEKYYDNLTGEEINVKQENYEVALTTVDNPFDYFDQFDEWLQFDTEKGYYSCNRLARIAEVTNEMTENEIAEEIERAIDTIIINDFLNVFKKVKRNVQNTEQI